MPQLSIRRGTRIPANGHLWNALARANGRLYRYPYPVNTLRTLRNPNLPGRDRIKNVFWIGMVGSARCSTDDDCWVHCIVHLRYDIKRDDGTDRMADVLSATMPDLRMPQMVLGIYARFRLVTGNTAANQAMNRSRGIAVLTMENQSPRLGYRGRYLERQNASPFLRRRGVANNTRVWSRASC